MQIKHRYYTITIIAATLFVIAALTLRASFPCHNQGGSVNDHIHADCASCVQNDQGEWVYFYLASWTGPCSGTQYGASVTIDIECGSNPTPVYVWPYGFMSATCDSQVFVGNCSYGECLGYTGPIQPPASRPLWTSAPCL